jgi:hypothetical protein
VAERRHTSRTKTRHLVIYLLAIVVPALVLLTLAWQSVARQRQAISTLTDANLRLSAGRLATTVETRVAELARGALADAASTLGVSASERRLALRAIHERARGLRSRHPIVRGVFVVDADGVFYPALEAAVPDDVATVATREASSDGTGASGDASAVHRVLRRFETAERDELIADRLEPALAGYQACAQSDAPDPLKALAWSRTARVATKLGRHDVARAALETLATAYGQESDLFGQPFGLSAPLPWRSRAAPTPPTPRA